MSQLWQKVKCFFGRHKWCARNEYLIGVGAIVVCQCCSTIAWRFQIVAWVEAQDYAGTVQAFTRTFSHPGSVPRTQRVPGSRCYPLIEEFKHPFTPYQGGQ